MAERRYDIEPLLTLTGLTYSAIARGVNGEAYRSIRTRGLTPYKADQLAVRHGFHPSQVWPSWETDEWEELSQPCVECETRFIPTRKGMKFCTHDCGHRHRERIKKRERYATDPEYAQRRRDQARAYYEEAQHASRVYRRAYYQANKDKERERQKAYDTANREKVNAARRKRYAARKQAA